MVMYDLVMSNSTPEFKIHIHNNCKNQLHLSPCPNDSINKILTPLVTLHNMADTHTYSVIPEYTLTSNVLKNSMNANNNNNNQNAMSRTSSGQSTESDDSTMNSMSIATYSSSDRYSGSTSSTNTNGSSSGSTPPPHSNTLHRIKHRPQIDIDRINSIKSIISHNESIQEKQSYQLLKPIFDYRRERQNQMNKLQSINNNNDNQQQSSTNIQQHKPNNVKMQYMP